MIKTLDSAKHVAKFCQKFNKDFQCKSTFGCNISCPLFIFREVAVLMREKHLTLGDAYRLTIRSGVKESIAKRIIESVFDLPLDKIQQIMVEYRDVGDTEV